MSISAKEALELARQGKAIVHRMEHSNGPTGPDATLFVAEVPTGKNLRLYDGSNLPLVDYVDLGELRPTAKTSVVPGTLRGQDTDRVIYEKFAK